MESDPPVKVVDGIFIGSINTVSSQGMRYIDAIINLSGTFYKTEKALINIMMDDAVVNLDNLDLYMKKFSIGVAAIETARKEGKNILIHCAAGINRSATLIAFYLIERGMALDDIIDALAVANKKRGVELLTNPTFRSILKTYYILQKNMKNRIAAFKKFSE